MLKWIASGCLVIIVVIGIVAYAGYRKMQSIAAAGPTVTVGIHAPAERVFASMSHSDSIAAWFAPGTILRVTKKGQLAAGDSIILRSNRDTLGSAWVIDTVLPGQLIAMRYVALPRGTVVFRRRDSVSTAADSTLVTSTVAFTMADSLANAQGQATGVTGGLLGMSATMGTAGARIQAEMELKRLKSHIEGPPVSRP